MIGIHTSIEYGTLPRMLKRLQSNEALKRGVPVGANYLRDKIAEYPPQRRKKQPPRSDRQRRFLHWAYRTGVLVSPYRRTGAMGKAWKVKLSNDGKTALITNPTQAARYTKHPQGQSYYHKGNFTTVDQDLRRYGPEANKRVYAAVEKSLQP